MELQGSYQEAEPLMKQSLTIRRKSLGPDHPFVAESLNNWAGLLIKQVRAGIFPWKWEAVCFEGCVGAMN